MASLTHKTTTGILWNLIQQLTSRGISVLVTLLLAYLLTPEDFGFIAMMAVFLNIANTLMDSGFEQALIRLKDATEVDLNTVFYANIVLAVLAYVVLYFSAPYIAEFYEQKELVDLLRVAGLTVLINAFKVVQVSSLSRVLNFKAQFKATLPASIIAAITALSLAYYGFGVWALVLQMLVSAFFVTLFLWLSNDWRPTIKVSINSLINLYGFGYKLFLSAGLEITFKNIYVMVIAKLFTASVAGLYFFADRIRELVIFQLVASVQNVTYPALATLQNDNERLKNAYRKVISLTTFVIFPVISLMAALAEPIFGLFLPEKWEPAALYLQLMCLATMFLPLHAINLNILNVKGRSDLFLFLEIIKKIMIVVILFVTFRFGVVGILVGQIINSILAYIPNSFFSEKLIGYTVKEQMFDICPALFLSVLIGGGVYILQAFFLWNDLYKVVALGLLGAGLYCWLAFILKLRSFRLVIELIRQRLSNNCS